MRAVHVHPCSSAAISGASSRLGQMPVTLIQEQGVTRNNEAQAKSVELFTDLSMNIRCRPNPVDETQRRMDTVMRLLSARTMAMDEIILATGSSQPTLSRTIHELPGSVQLRVRGVRTPRYGVIRRLPGNIAGQQNVYRITATGSVLQAGLISLLSGGETFMQMSKVGRLYDGLPPSMAFASPSGFLGRQTAHAVAADLQLPDSLRDWSDDHRAAYLLARGWNLAGDLVFGDAALAQLMEFRSAAPTAPGLKLDLYSQMTSNIKGSAVGSSAGGEQPKFLAYTEDRGHVLVKFAALGTRMAELLRMENVALDCLRGTGVPCATTHFVEHTGYAYLEVERFDRAGAYGRVGMVSAGALDDEIFGQRDSWSQFADRCEAKRFLGTEQAHRFHIMAAYSELIGNSDRHFENISLLLDETGDVCDVAPAYDILPMKYAPIGAGVVPDLNPIAPKLGSIGARAGVWSAAGRAAQEFWTKCRDDERIGLSSSMRALAGVNLRVVQQFVMPLDASASMLR